MTSSENKSDEISDEERQHDLKVKGTPLDAEETAATKFRQEIASKQAGLDDFEPEENLWQGGYSPNAMIGTWVVMGIASIAILILAAMVTQLSWAVALGLIVLLWIIGGLLYGYRRLGFHYQLTTQRFIHQTGIFTRQTDRIEVIDIDDVSYSQGPIQRAFGVGTIQLTGSDRTHPTLSMNGIAKVKEVSGLIDDIRRAERRKRSLHIESI
ncbi:PH domain-containing protein [Planctomycetes bacterium K23_9]|uniref:Bacterial membrane flanked domain protein n=1 Tax=Stieleria marina TaxID=1930275 RepID=A0A517P142_9BACT|nr:Bacterial membrane flanked domain protein [Planctomycetes bacterium K23_9]